MFRGISSEGCEALVQDSQRSCGCPIAEGIQPPIWMGLGQPDLVDGIPLSPFLRFLPTQAILWFHEAFSRAKCNDDANRGCAIKCCVATDAHKSMRCIF